MKATIEALVAGHRNAEIDQLLPWNFRVLRAAAADVTSLYQQTSRQNRRKALQQILQSLLQMMFAARAAKTAGVNRKSYVIQTPLTLDPFR